MKNKAHFNYWPVGVPKTLKPPKTTLYEGLKIKVKEYPEKIAIHYYGATYTYQALFDEVEKLAGYMEKELGIKEQDHILLLMQNSPQFIISFFAILRLRAVVVPINPMSLTNDLEFYVKDCDINHAIVGQELVEKVLPLQKDNILENMIIAIYSDYVDKELQDLPPTVSDPVKRYDKAISWKDALNKGLLPSVYKGEMEDVAVIPYTSGTTGLPKGCVHTNSTVLTNIVGGCQWSNVVADTTVLATLPYFHVTGLVHSALAPIYAGCSLVIMTRWDREYARKAIRKYRCTHWVVISTMLIDFLSNPNLETEDLSSLELISGGGASLPAAVGEDLFRRTGLQYIEGYGLTETISQTHSNPSHRPKFQCLGIPVFDVDARIIDTVTGEELGVNQEGELVVNGPQVFIGYYQRDEENEKAHIEIDGKRFFRTGDIVRMDEEGYFFIVDRLKRMINASGYKVWPTEVESILYKHPAVQQACVVSSPDKRRGETVKAFIILNDDYKNKIKEIDIIKWSKEQMAAYRYPRIVEFMDQFPTTSSGKILWRKLQEREYS